MTTRFAPFLHTVAIASVALALAVSPAGAKAGGGFSSGSRGARTFSAPPSTATAPTAAQPMQRTETPSFGASRPGLGAAPAAGPRFGFGTGMMAGLLGAGVLGMLLGHGFTGGLFGLTSFLGFLFQIALVGGLVWLAVRFLRRRAEPAFAGAGAPYARSATGPVPGPIPAGGSAGPRVRDEVVIGPSDYAGFEQSLTEIQSAYGREDMARLSSLATPEMVRYLGTDLEANRRNNVRNEVRDAKLLQGDLAEAWREGPTDYATVAMRFSLIDAILDRNTGRVMSGDLSRPEEVREIWTFRRDRGGPWILSAIQQTS